MARFRTRARAVDMLGRQQIAGIPTAISELFKNAHDAYAHQAVVDFFREDGLVVLRDDGIGMTPVEFESRWLTLGTESKINMGTEPIAPPRQGVARRAVLGEKGIGRLAIAAIGPQVLVLTRAERHGITGDVLVAFLHWGLYEIPGVDLEEIDVPMLVLPDNALPGREEVASLLSRVRSNLQDLEARAPSTLVLRIERDLSDFEAIAPDELAPVLGVPGLRDGPGTHFLIRPSSPLLAADVRRSHEDATELLRTLVGFTNTMTPGHRLPAMLTSFQDHYAEDAREDIIEVSDFFTPDEFEAADHRIVGRFDEYGQFEGRLSIYGDEPVPYTVPWPQARGACTQCGPFHLDLAYLQGLQRQSRLPPDEFKAISDKLDRYAGLYIYRDGIRVLPYGNSDYDWLDVERRRTISASDYFFSYRRMFGAIEITRAANGELREKAGREGFATNQAYRQFRDVLMNFLYRVAFDFFREDPALTDRFRARRDELEHFDRVRQQRERQVRERRKKLQADLDQFFDRIGDNAPRREVDAIVARVEADLGSASRITAPGEAAEALIRVEASARQALDELGAAYEVRRPRGVGLTQQLARLMRAYDARRIELVEQVIAPAAQEVENLIAHATGQHESQISRRVRFDRAVQVASEHGRNKANTERRDLLQAREATDAQAVELARESLAAVDRTVSDVLARASRLDLSLLSDDEYVRERSVLEADLVEAVEGRSRALASVTEQLRAIVWPTNGDGPLMTQFDTMEAIETDLEALRERSEQDLQLTQLGIAIEVVNHEFRGTVRSIRRSLNRIKAWADRNKALREPYQELRRNFEHLDGYLKLFTPLDRRLNRSRVDISGYDLERFVRNLFAERLARHDIELAATLSFQEHRLHEFPSTIYPVFVNLVDNALYWLTDYPGSRRIALDRRPGVLVVTDTGPGVPQRDREAVFELGFTRKPGGSGYGLHISREVLQREGMDLRVAPPSADQGAGFLIVEREDTSQNDEAS